MRRWHGGGGDAGAGTADPSRRAADPDSRARTHLANERTFLAWLRTGLSLVALGVGAAQFLDGDLLLGVPVTTLFSVFLVTSGVVLTVVGGVHYAHGRDEIEAGTFRATSMATVAAAALVVVVGLMALVLVVLLRING